MDNNNNFVDDKNNIIEKNNDQNNKTPENNGESPKKSSKFNNTLRLLFLFSFGAPAIFFLLQKNHQKILWRKIDNENLKTLQIVLSLMNPGFDREYLLKVHVTKYNDAAKIINVSDMEVIDFIHQQSMFQKDNKFSSDLYKKFINKHDLIETHLINIMKEILIIKKYENYNYKDKMPTAMAIINPLMDQYFSNFLNNLNKEIKYSLFFFKKNSIPNPAFTLKEKQDTYEKLKEKRKTIVFSDKQIHGLLIKIPVNQYPVNITPKEIKDYYETHDKIYKQKENLHTFIIFSRDKKELEQTIQNFYNRELSLNDIQNQYETQLRVFNSLSDKEFSNFKNLLNQQGLNNFIINEIPGQGFIGVAVIKQEIQEVSLSQATPFIDKKIRHQKLLKLINEEMINIKEKPEYIKKYKTTSYTIQNKEDPYYKLRKNQFEINNSEIIIFIQKTIDDKKILSFAAAESKVVEYMTKKYKKEKFKEIFASNLQRIKEKKPIDTIFFDRKEGVINLSNLLEKQKVAHIVLQNLRNSYFTRKENIAVNTLTYGSKFSVDGQWVKEFLKMIEEKETAIEINGKIGYCNSMAKYENKIIVTIKDFFDVLLN